jgi:hypothetical protein
MLVLVFALEFARDRQDEESEDGDEPAEEPGPAAAGTTTAGRARAGGLPWRPDRGGFYIAVTRRSGAERDRPRLIAAGRPLARCVPATPPRPSGRSPADRQVTTLRHGRRRKPWLPIAPGARRRCPRVLQNASLQSGFAARGIELLQRVERCCRQPPPHAAIGRRERALSCVLMPGRPARRAAQPNLNRSDTTPIPTEYKASKRPLRSQWVGVEPCVRFRRTSSNGGELHQ